MNNEQLNNSLNETEILNIIINKTIIPFVFKENGIYKGYEINLINSFSYE